LSASLTKLRVDYEVDLQKLCLLRNPVPRTKEALETKRTLPLLKQTINVKLKSSLSIALRLGLRRMAKLSFI
jgi:hypothetical protein